MISPDGVNLSSSEQRILCILCGKPLLSLSIEEKYPREYVYNLVCVHHTDTELRDQDLEDIWGGRDISQSNAFFENQSFHIVGVWEQGPGGVHGVYFLLSNGDLVLISTCGLPFVTMARVPRSRRVLDHPVGIPFCLRTPWTTAMKEGWKVTALRLMYNAHHSEEVQVEFGEKGTLTFSSEPATWKEMGDFTYFLYETRNFR